MISNGPNSDYRTSYDPVRLTARNDACFSTGVNLPQGSRITQFAVWYSSEANDNPTVHLQRTNLANGTSTALLASQSIVGDSGFHELAVIPIAGGSSLVSNIGFAYGLGFCPGTNGSFRGARIAYTYTSAGD